MDGFETLRQLRAVPAMAQVFAIAMTGYGSQDDKRRTQDAGFDAHLIKPVELEGLIRLLNDARVRAARTGLQ
jgi:CheY-like chemotaxis protein